MLDDKIIDKTSEAALQIYDENGVYVERATDSIYKHFSSIGHKWAGEDITRDMIEETIVDLIDTIVTSDEKMDCDEAGTGCILVRVDTENNYPDSKDKDYYDLTIMLEF